MNKNMMRDDHDEIKSKTQLRSNKKRFCATEMVWIFKNAERKLTCWLLDLKAGWYRGRVMYSGFLWRKGN